VKKLMSAMLATTMATTFAIASVVPLNAAPLFVPKTETAQTGVQTVQYQPWRKMGRRAARNDGRFYRRGDVNYYNGHRGYRTYHRGYREYNGFWFPAAAFIAGALVTSAINNAPRSGSAHVQWCYDHYRSYRAWDNTYQPYNGPRRQC
jgi:hypothetical protein